MFEGGYATVSKALLGFLFDDTGVQFVESSSGNLTSNDRIAKLEDDNKRREEEESNEKAEVNDGDTANVQALKSDGKTSGQLKVSGNHVLPSSMRKS